MGNAALTHSCPEGRRKIINTMEGADLQAQELASNHADPSSDLTHQHLSPNNLFENNNNNKENVLLNSQI